MICRKLISNYLKDNNYSFSDNSNGINISLDNNELLIKGSGSDLVDFADYILDVALSNSKDHLHLDELTVVNKNSNINNIIIERE